jgi:hypothetical protein
MIFQAPPAVSAAPPVAVVAAERSASGRTFNANASGESPSPPAAEFSAPADGDTLELQPREVPVREKFDWSSPKLNREFIRLEQKSLARKASPEETGRYQAMRRDRNSQLFADRYLSDYAEIRRLRKLAEKLAEIQQYLRPVRLG